MTETDPPVLKPLGDIPLRDGYALFLDVDGTLVPIAEHPDKIEVEYALLNVLRELSWYLDGALALISGRKLSNLDQLFAPLYLPTAGVHGLEWRLAGTPPKIYESDDALPDVHRAIKTFAEDRPGLMVENKAQSVALHYRGAAEHEKDVFDFIEATLFEHGGNLKSVKGKMVIEVKSAAHNKGTAIRAFMDEKPFKGRRPVFIGDDVTDEDGFAAVRKMNGYAVRVGQPGETAAEFGCENVRDVLTWLVDLKKSLAKETPRKNGENKKRA